MKSIWVNASHWPRSIKTTNVTQSPHDAKGTPQPPAGQHHSPNPAALQHPAPPTELCWADFEPPGHNPAALRHAEERTERRFGTKHRAQTTAALMTSGARPPVLPAWLSWRAHAYPAAPQRAAPCARGHTEKLRAAHTWRSVGRGPGQPEQTGVGPAHCRSASLPTQTVPWFCAYLAPRYKRRAWPGQPGSAAPHPADKRQRKRGHVRRRSAPSGAPRGVGATLPASPRARLRAPRGAVRPKPRGTTTTGAPGNTAEPRGQRRTCTMRARRSESLAMLSPHFLHDARPLLAYSARYGLSPVSAIAAERRAPHPEPRRAEPRRAPAAGSASRAPSTLPAPAPGRHPTLGQRLAMSGGAWNLPVRSGVSMEGAGSGGHVAGAGGGAFCVHLTSEVIACSGSRGRWQYSLAGERRCGALKFLQPVAECFSVPLMATPRFVARGLPAYHYPWGNSSSTNVYSASENTFCLYGIYL